MEEIGVEANCVERLAQPRLLLTCDAHACASKGEERQRREHELIIRVLGSVLVKVGARRIVGATEEGVLDRLEVGTTVDFELLEDALLDTLDHLVQERHGLPHLREALVMDRQHRLPLVCLVATERVRVRLQPPSLDRRRILFQGGLQGQNTVPEMVAELPVGLDGQVVVVVEIEAPDAAFAVPLTGADLLIARLNHV